MSHDCTSGFAAAGGNRPDRHNLQSACAAGTSEPTIFRAFADKTEVLAAYLEEATKPEHTAMELEAIELEAGLEQRVMDLIDVIRLQGERTGAVVNAIRLAAPAKPRDRLELSDEDICQLNEQRTIRTRSFTALSVEYRHRTNRVYVSRYPILQS